MRSAPPLAPALSPNNRGGANGAGDVSTAAGRKAPAHAPHPFCAPAAEPASPPAARGRDRERIRPAEDWRSGGFGVYVHWPFCLSKCPYCDFNSHVAKGPVEQDRWRSALLAELSAARARTGSRPVHSVFFGGGTPSLMPPETIAALIERIDVLWGLEPEAEVSLEANPTSVEADRFASYAAAGVNRVSMGVQSLRDADLRALGRTHTVAEARRAFEIARARFPRVSFDLIYARPGQSLVEWEAELGEAVAMAVDHLSLYQLTIEPGTRFAELNARGRLRTLPDETGAEMYALTQDLCAAAGMPAYEISNHARPGAASRHNLVYWRYGDYAGVGPGAHGRVTGPDGLRRATVAERDPSAWLGLVEAKGDSFTEEAVAQEDQAVEMLMMGLRLVEGVEEARFARLAGRPLEAERLAPLLREGLLRREDRRLAATEAGRPLLDALLRALLA